MPWIMKIIDERETQKKAKQNKQTKKGSKEQRGTEAIVKG